jgi:hypothetical protein
MEELPTGGSTSMDQTMTSTGTEGVEMCGESLAKPSERPSRDLVNSLGNLACRLANVV